MFIMIGVSVLKVRKEQKFLVLPMERSHFHTLSNMYLNRDPLPKKVTFKLQVNGLRYTKNQDWISYKSSLESIRII